MMQVSGKIWGQDHGVSPSNTNNAGIPQVGKHPWQASEAWLSPLGLERADNSSALALTTIPLFLAKYPVRVFELLWGHKLWERAARQLHQNWGS